ncbi:dienelactone hydrolase [Actinobacteria bacterium YIM 96077]|uniref:Dienelactone hydrolase n=1 Tax=Phytoactinopolyspora halophila TaxID=1981511 RepID=A0A329QVI8_9ACTN|nr:dienelactone hydrolase family protein [Phytoactinopolyspora halophila]AYY13777.1 dienelactone hydrolase [Actinobacteria bacterium YIM 96077]RAW15679.1 dienelactone hydrolase [Phytoactinopolyspora halophila]
MADVLLFHHAHGRTGAFLEFAQNIRNAGHTVHTPDLYEGKTFTDLDAGVAFAEQVGFSEIVSRGVAAANELSSEIVYAGFSLGALPAQALAQTRPGAVGAVLFHGGVPASELGRPWPAGVPLQIHVMEGDEWSELDACRALAEAARSAELFVYPGTGHLFADADSPDYEPASARLLLDRTLTFLQSVS